MASGSSFLSEDHFCCSICLDVLSEPVSIPCGHSFCHACIRRHWDGNQQRQCPLCKERFPAELRLRINTAFRDVVDDFKNQCRERPRDAGPAPAQPDQVPARPGQVPCDCCLGSKFRAAKTCLVCLASYCEIHLEPHRTVDALRRHTLTDPVQNLEDRICTKHNRMLELFCRDDMTCICVLCTDHSAHDTVALEKAFVNKKGHAGKKKVAGKSKKCRKKGQRSQAGQQPRRSDDSTANGAESNQQPHVWWRPTGGAQEHSTRLPAGNRPFLLAGADWRLTVVSECVSGHNIITQIHHNGPYCIWHQDPGQAPPSEPVQLFLVKTPDGVWVILDYESEQAFFHDSQTNIMIYSLQGSRFVKRYYLCFIPTTTRIDTQRLLGTVQTMKACLSRPRNTNSCLFVVCVFLFVIFCISFLRP
ncbi:uncharacterized protein LOC114842676 [Betta splendens]|uniref:Uncharacterized protein LOC114842676 n=1 Tax=Betta splendens TaxID=158456 RepID=A0A6P7KUJ8_BETSP|nr:uncharacterized protein LOC114842676 [Betta splendens]XP_028984245.1 uncharacterized protein LOC114842676 [Betta splendens]XP_055358988.1 uncharacterized protein LOC114842676 [Betta splendens]